MRTFRRGENGRLKKSETRVWSLANIYTFKSLAKMLAGSRIVLSYTFYASHAQIKPISLVELRHKQQPLLAVHPQSTLSSWIPLKR